MTAPAASVRPLRVLVIDGKPATGMLRCNRRPDGFKSNFSAGGTVEAKVSRRTDYVIVGEGGGAKLAEAAAFAVPMIDEARLQQLLRPSAAWQ